MPASHPAQLPTAGALADAPSWYTDPKAADHLRRAMVGLLYDLERTLSEDRPFSQTVAGSSVASMQVVGIHDSWGPLLEAEAVRLVVEEAGLDSPSLASSDLPHAVAAIDHQPLDVQQLLVHNAWRRHLPASHGVPDDERIQAASLSGPAARRAVPIDQQVLVHVSHARINATRARRR